jgi:hypothetical protein
MMGPEEGVVMSVRRVLPAPWGHPATEAVAGLRGLRALAVVFAVAILAGNAGASPALAADAEGAAITLLPGDGGAWVERILSSDERAAGAGEIGLPPSLDPSSLRVSPAGEARALTVRLEPPVAPYPGHFEACRGGEVTVLTHEDDAEPSRAVPARLVRAGSSDRAVVRLEDGRLMAVRADRVLCADGRERLGTLWWLGLPDAPSGDLSLIYRLDGWGWRGSHRLELADDARSGRLRVEALSTIPPGVDHEAAHLRLLAGDLPRVGGGGARPMRQKSRADVTFAAAESAGAPVTESRGQDLLIFDLDEPLDVRGPSMTRLPLREPAELAIDDVIRVEAPVPHRTGRNDERDLTGRRHLRFDAPPGKPIPAGVVDVGVRREDGRFLPLGEASVPRTAPGEQADLTLGQVGDLVVRWRLTDQRALGNDPYTQQVEVVVDIDNPRPRRAVVELVQPMGGAHELLSAQPAPATKGGASVTWRIELPAAASETVRLTAKVDPRRRR